MSLFNQENKKLNLFILTKKDTPDVFLCITLSKDEANEYAHALLKFAHRPHFQAWCALRDYDYTEESSWNEYFLTCINDAEKSQYIIRKVTYKLKDIVAIMRMFGGCSPIGCAFESEIEHDYAKSKKDILECQLEFEKFWREHHSDVIEEPSNGT